MRDEKAAHFSDVLLAIEMRAREKDVSLEELLDLVGPGGADFVSLLVVLPFLQPIPLPGLSVPLGLAATAFGVCEMWRAAVYLPKKLARARVPGAVVARLVDVVRRVFGQLERLGLGRRRHPIFELDWFRRGLGFAIAVHGLILALPLPIPLTNFAPALVIALLALASLEGDATVLAVALLALLGNAVFFYSLVALPLRGVELWSTWLNF